MILCNCTVVESKKAKKSIPLINSTYLQIATALFPASFGMYWLISKPMVGRYCKKFILTDILDRNCNGGNQIILLSVRNTCCIIGSSTLMAGNGHRLWTGIWISKPFLKTLAGIR
ncbi:MAG TPA: hypothetical protein VHO70_18475 [Chitinispirillaceae bacterium]|nr:hypothetical protein [Chitinispirillaceae bacterium]